MVEDVIIETRDLTKEFKGFVAVSNCNLRVRRGEIHALIGPNGAGKTTFFNLLTKFLAPTRGSIVYNAADITAKKPAELARRGYNVFAGVRKPADAERLAAQSPHRFIVRDLLAADTRELAVHKVGAHFTGQHLIAPVADML